MLTWVLQLLAATALWACSLEKTYDGKLETTTVLTQPTSTTRSDSRPAIVHTRGGQDGTHYELLDNKGTPPCSFFLPSSGGDTNGTGTCTLLLQEGAVQASLVSLRTDPRDDDWMVLRLEWKVQQVEADGGVSPLVGTVKMTFEGEAR